MLDISLVVLKITLFEFVICIITTLIYILSNNSYHNIPHEYTISFLKEEQNCKTVAELPQFLDMIF